nr:unnamed protein product [Callosobruchus analis]
MYIEKPALIGATFSEVYGSATYVRSETQGAELTSCNSDNGVFTTSVKVNGLSVINLYKPPRNDWPPNVIPTSDSRPSVYIGDFNSHHNLWGYESNDRSGELLHEWAEINNLQLVFNAKDRPTFYSRRWLRGYNPDLCFVSCDAQSLPLPNVRVVLPDFPHSQHRPVLMEVGTQIPLVESTARPRWNFNKADWSMFAEELDRCIRFIPPKPKNYHRFVNLVQAVARKHIPRGFRDEYIPGWTDESQHLYDEFEKSGDPEIADSLLRTLDTTRMNKWASTVEHLDFTHSSRKAWSLLRRLGGTNRNKNLNKPTIHPNKIANRIVEVSRAPSDKAHTKSVKKSLISSFRKMLLQADSPSTPMKGNGTPSMLALTAVFRFLTSWAEKSKPKPRWNFRKANWNGFKKQLDDDIRWIEPKVENYHRSASLVISTAKKHVELENLTFQVGMKDVNSTIRRIARLDRRKQLKNC